PEVSMAVNPTNPQNIVVAEVPPTDPDAPCDAFFTTDGGSTWNLVKLDSGVDGVANLMQRSDASVPFDSKPRVYVAYLASASDFSYMIVDTSTDGGATYSSANVTKDPAPADFNDKELLGTAPAPGNPSQQNVYLAWVHFTPQDSTIVISGSEDG